MPPRQWSGTQRNGDEYLRLEPVTWPRLTPHFVMCVLFWLRAPFPHTRMCAKLHSTNGFRSRMQCAHQLLRMRHMQWLSCGVLVPSVHIHRTFRVPHVYMRLCNCMRWLNCTTMGNITPQCCHVCVPICPTAPLPDTVICATVHTTCGFRSCPPGAHLFF